MLIWTGQYDGAGAIERAYKDYKDGKLKDKGDKTGTMVHHVIKEVDQGAPILTKEIEFRAGENLADFETRLHSHEHELIVQATAKVVQDIMSRKGQ